MAPTASAAPHRSAEKPLQAMQDLASQDSEFTTQARHSLILCICNVVLSLSVSRYLFVDSRASGSAFQERVLHRAFSVALGKSKSKHTQMPVTLKFKKGCCVKDHSAQGLLQQADLPPKKSNGGQGSPLISKHLHLSNPFKLCRLSLQARLEMQL